MTLTTLSTALHSRPLRRRRARRAARAHAPDRHARTTPTATSPSKASRTATGTERSGRRRTSAARPGVLDGVSLVGDGAISDRVWARHAISVLGLDAPAGRRRGQHRDPAGAREDRRPRPAGRGPGALDGRGRAPPARARPVGRAAGDRARARLDGDRPQRRRSRAERALEQAYGKPVARMGSGGSVPLVAKLRAAYPDAALILWGAQDSDLAPHPRRQRVGRPRRGGEDRARRGPAAGGPQPVLTVRAGELRAVNTALPPKRALKRSRP